MYRRSGRMRKRTVKDYLDKHPEAAPLKHLIVDVIDRKLIDVASRDAYDRIGKAHKYVLDNR